MSKIALSGNASGTGTLTIASQNTNSNYTLTIPNETGTLTTTASTPTFTGAVTAPSFIPNGSSAPTNGLYLPAANAVGIATNSTNRIYIDSSGNVGVGITPNNSYSTGYRTLQVGNIGLFGKTSGNESYFLSNTYISASDGNPYYQYTSYATQYQTYNGEHIWKTAPSGTADNAITFTERARITNGGDFNFNSGYGSAVTAYGCRAWVNFNGTGTVAIRANGNVSSITDNGTGDYTVNYTNAFPDANYALNAIARGSGSGDSSANNVCIGSATAPSTSATRIVVRNDAGGAVDVDTIAVTVHR